MSKAYALITGEPLTDFEQSILKMLHTVAETGTPRAMVGAILMDGDEVVTCYHQATMQDMMVAKGFIDLDIQNDNILSNLPWYTKQMWKEGLLDEDFAEDEDFEEEGY
jgi:hypothetical protein